ncbi:MAG: cell wall hydrolase [Alicyclobacillaceae bacterium]|nr:cell wall hydrolase [Alicyclobacillaceae bacterium]
MRSHVRRWAVAACSTAAFSMVPAVPAMAAVVTVKPGDSFWKIAHRYHVPLISVERANPGVDPLNLPIGYQVQVPTYQAMAKATAANAKSAKAKAVPAAAHATAVAASRRNSAAYSHADLYWMEHVIHAEAGAEPFEAKIAVGNVVMHRLKKMGTGHSVKDVVFAVDSGHYQFTCVANGYIYSNPDSGSVQAARTVLAQTKDVVPGAFVFYNPAETPDGSWVWNQPVIRRIGHLVFAK